MNTDANKRLAGSVDAGNGQKRPPGPSPVPTQQPQASAGVAPSTPTPAAAANAEAVTASGLADSVGDGGAELSSGAAETALHEGVRPATDAHKSQKRSAVTTRQLGAPISPRPEIETLDQFIEYAYSRRGQRVAVKPKAGQRLAQNSRIDDEALSRLQALAESDILLAVPRQLLLFSRELKGLPRLQASINTFVSNVMLRHPVFANTAAQAVIRNLPDAPQPAQAVLAISDYAPAASQGKDGLKPGDLKVLRLNAGQLLAIWVACDRGLDADDLMPLLHQAIWEPAARELADGNSRLRALTDVEHPEVIGLACQRFRQQASDARASQDRAQRDAESLRKHVAEVDEQHQKARSELEAAQAELAALRKNTVTELSNLRAQHEVERVHLRHAHDQLRGRMVRRIEEGLQMLEVGLTALRNKTPRVEVMVERAEHVVDTLRAEAAMLKGE